MSYPFELNPQLVPNEQQKTTLWMGELEQWHDEVYIQQLWFNLNEKVMVKVIRDKVTGSISAGYAFVDFGTATAARRAMNHYNGVLMPNSLKPFKLNWASGGGLIDRREDRQPEYSIFVGDLSPETTEIDLLVVFQSRYMSCKSAKIMTDPRTGMTRGYGFVRFAEQLDQQRALLEMQGYFIGSRAIRVSVATPKNRASQQQHPLLQSQSQQLQLLQQLQLQQLQQQQQQQQQQQTFANTAVSTPSSCSLLTSPNKSPLLRNLHSPTIKQELVPMNQPTNTTVFVGGLSAPICEEELRQYFQHFGEIVYVKIPPGKGCGFVQYVSRSCAELAIQQMNGYQIGNSRIRLSWGRSQNEKSTTTSVNTTPSSVGSPPSINLPHPAGMLNTGYLTFSSTFMPLAQQQHSSSQHSPFPSIQQEQHGYPSDFKFLSADSLLDATTDDLFNSVTRSLLDTAEQDQKFLLHQQHPQQPQQQQPQQQQRQQQQQQQQQQQNVDWRLNQIYAQ
ncbi:hypothetical protein [Parasitella parasitica]|uniref:RRM domain-containing protein n=1 Tax=Parasitella parasitica TaxID=35722 RepID=A0A0B7NAU1_9FUNG|nr:hypothetical protein [Parasitella parasitica]